MYVLLYSKRAVQEVQELGKICVLDIDIQGVKQIKSTDLNPLYVFIKPPSLAELERRLKERKTETAESLKHRLAVAKTELEYGTICRICNILLMFQCIYYIEYIVLVFTGETPGNFNLVIENDNLEKAYGILRNFIVANYNAQGK